MNSRPLLAAIAVLSALALTACSNADLYGPGPASQTIVVGSQDYYSNEIIAEIYAQALEHGGYTVDRQFRIGQREVYLPEIEAGHIDLFPEYTGPLLQYWKPDTTATQADQVYAQLQAATPSDLRVLDQSSATDQDSYVVTQAFAAQWEVTSIADLAKVTVPMTMGANSEAQTRPNGPQGLLKAYGVHVGFTPIEDGGGPLTVKALADNQIQLAILYSADPAITTDNLVSLSDPKGLFLASHVVPLASDRVDAAAASIINAVSAAMTPADLVALNARSVDDELPASTIARDWLTQRHLT
ncbi:MAG: ABC transporter substrate-binding protein [Propionibacteriaceae bacterium]|nr:ABC transporter substrate-binding protein [Propionibacteriaceae bacterium]